MKMDQFSCFEVRIAKVGLAIDTDFDFDFDFDFFWFKRLGWSFLEIAVEAAPGDTDEFVDGGFEVV